MVLPPSFFDIQVHLVSHLIEEIEIAGVVHARWMYWAERFMKVRNHPYYLICNCVCIYMYVQYNIKILLNFPN